VVVEVVFGVLARSLALLADGGHNLGDVLGLGLAWGAMILARRRPTPNRTYGLRRSTILAAFINAVLLLVASGGIAWEAVLRLAHPAPVAGPTVVIVAGAGILVNTATALLFWRGRRQDINIRGAFLHMAADAGVSAGVLVSGLMIELTGQPLIDPVVSLLIVLAIALSTWGLLRHSFDLMLDAVPRGIDPHEVQAYLAALPGVAAVHDLHIWATSTTETALTAHLIKPDPAGDDQLLAEICETLHHEYDIDHPTLQWERGTPGVACKLNSGGTRPQDGRHTGEP
jgi:cobalt-zinc-cadmium efflux system protein